MKKFWEIDINNSTANLIADNFEYKIRFTIELVDNGIFVKQKELINGEESILNISFVSNLDTYMKNLAKELDFLYLRKTFETSIQCDMTLKDMYKIEDNLYVSEDSEIYVFVNDTFIETNFATITPNINKDTPINLVKLTILDMENITYKGHIIDFINKTMDGVRFFHYVAEDFKDNKEKKNLDKQDVELLINNECDILVLNDTKQYMYSNYTSISEKHDSKDAYLLGILEEVLCENKINEEVLSFNDVQKKLEL